MRHLFGLLMVMGILAFSLIRPDIKKSVEDINQEAIRTCFELQSKEDGESRNSVSLEEAWTRCDPNARSESMLTAGMFGKIKLRF